MKKYIHLLIITLTIIFGSIITITTKSWDSMYMAWLAVIACNQLEILDTIKEKKLN